MPLSVLPSLQPKPTIAFDHAVTDYFACKDCKHRARDMIHHAEARQSLLPSCAVAEEPEVERYDVVPFLLRILSPLSPVRIFLCS